MRFDRVLVTGAAGLLGGYVVGELDGRTRVSGLDIAAPARAMPFVAGAVEDPAAVAAAVAGCDAVVHIAARPNIWSGAGHEIIHTNVTGTWNVLAAAEAAGVQRVVLVSSDSVVGFTVASGAMLPPDYLPIDAAHPLRPTDAYALSKKLGEEAGRSFLDRGRLEVVVLRPVYILYPEFEAEVKARAADPRHYRGPAAGGRQPAGGGPLWHYVDPRDAARAVRLALEAAAPGFGPYFVSAATTLAPEATLDRLAQRVGRDIPVARPEVYRESPFAPLYDLAAARERLGFAARHDRRDLLYPRSLP